MLGSSTAGPTLPPKMLQPYSLFREDDLIVILDGGVLLITHLHLELLQLLQPYSHFREDDLVVILDGGVLLITHLHLKLLQLQQPYSLLREDDLVVILDGGVLLITHLHLELVEHVHTPLLQLLPVLLSLGAPEGSLDLHTLQYTTAVQCTLQPGKTRRFPGSARPAVQHSSTVYSSAWEHQKVPRICKPCSTAQQYTVLFSLGTPEGTLESARPAVQHRSISPPPPPPSHISPLTSSSVGAAFFR